jgi:uncharacterized membrane protein
MSANNILTEVRGLDAVEQVKAWNDRHYVTLAAVRGSRANADLRAKIWLKGAVLTIESAKGYHSDAYIAQKSALISAVEQAGGTVRTI